MDDAIALLGELLIQKAVDSHLVVDDQDGAVAAARGRLQRPTVGVGSRSGADGRQSHRKRGSLPIDTLDRDVPAPHPAEMPGDGEAEPGAAIVARNGRFGLAKGLEESVLLLRCHADTRVRDAKPETVPAT